jgi:hypothetical protein
MPIRPVRRYEEATMNLTRFTASAAALGGLAAMSVLGVAPASAVSLADGCPAGYTALSVADLTSQGYRVPGQVDDPASGLLSYGRPGNGDGVVCGVQLGNQLTTFGDPLYNFMDDTLPAS